MATAAPLGVLAALTVGDVGDGSAIQLPDGELVRVPRYAVGIVRAHLAFRRSEGAADCDPFFATHTRGKAAKERPLKSSTPNALRQVLNAIARDTGVALTARGAAWARPTEEQWQRRYGVSVQPLEVAA